MAMSLAALEILEQAHFPPAQARAITRVLEVETAAHREALSSKADLAELRHGLKSDLADLRQCTQAGIAELRQSSLSGMAGLRQSLQGEMMDLGQSLRGEMAGFRQAVTSDIGRLEVKIEAAKAEGVRWTFLAIIGQATLLAGLMYFLLQNTR